MAILTRTVNGSHTEIYIGGDNSWITQSAPTNFHRFFKRRVLTAKKSVEDFMEITEAEKAQLEKSDAEWTEPSEEFVAQCRSLNIDYYPDTGYFGLNGLTDLTENQTRAIIKAGIFKATYNNCALINKSIRTHLLPDSNISVWKYDRTFFNCLLLEVALVPMMYDGIETFTNCKNLKRVSKFHGIRENGIAGDIFKGCVSLSQIDNFKFAMMTKDCTVNLKSLPALNLGTLRMLVDSKNHPGWEVFKVTITVHPDVYAKLTDESNTEWHQVLLDAAEKQITFATPS